MKVGDRYMNEVIRQLHERKSVRVFTEREISKQEKKEILEAAGFLCAQIQFGFCKGNVKICSEVPGGF